MTDLTFPDDLYVNVRKIYTGVKVEIYKRVEEKKGGIICMRRDGVIWLSSDERTLERLIERLKNRTSWNENI